ncbi:outer membrane protein transport protein [Halosquirtibacter laminarini]|uniref:Outer membrane protein transport protein n=1 Tax=Halosquirtibacter laminarini TaxID=3374600 RepID=A0AC61NJ21_9BACT|nr:outer membrane protein transport protein [Prolixibacteraceae bacterium]
MRNTIQFLEDRAAWLLVLGLLLLSGNLFAQQGGLLLYEVGTPNIGNANAGQGAVSHDASTVYFNPAAMTEVENQGWLIGIQAMIPRFNYHSETSSSSDDNAGGFTPALGVYWMKHINTQWSVGATLNFPMGSALDYGTDWDGKYYLTEATLVVVNIAPAVAYKLNDQWSFGFGLNLYLGMLSEKMMIPRVISGSQDADAEMDGTSFNVGFQLGVHYRMNEKTTLGLTYRYKSDIDFSGDADVNNFNRGGITQTSVPFSTEMVIPHGINLSLSQYMGDFELLFDVGYTNWKSFDYQPIILQEEYSVEMNRDWQDTYRIGIGTNYFINDQWTARAGVSYDTSPVEDQYRTPDLPLCEIWRFGVGGTKKLGEKMNLSLSYNFMYGPDNKIDQTSPIRGDLVGEYDPTNVHTIAISLGF